MVFNSKSKKCCWGIVSENVVELFRNRCFWVAFSINALDFPESHCNGNSSFWPRPGHFDIGCFSLSRERALFTFQPIFFSQNLTPAHLFIHTHIMMHTLSLSDFGQNNRRPKWLALKIGQNDPPTKSETTHPLNLDLLLSFTVLRSES